MWQETIEKTEPGLPMEEVMGRLERRYQAMIRRKKQAYTILFSGPCDPFWVLKPVDMSHKSCYRKMPG
jgi:hypothetical protein